MDIEDLFFYALKSLLQAIPSCDKKDIDILQGIISVIIGYDLKNFNIEDRDDSQIDINKRIAILINDIFNNESFPLFENQNASLDREKIFAGFIYVHEMLQDNLKEFSGSNFEEAHNLALRFIDIVETMGIVSLKSLSYISFFIDMVYYTNKKEYDSVIPLFVAFSSGQPNMIQNVIQVYDRAKNILKFNNVNKEINNMAMTIEQSKKNPEVWKALIQKVEDGTAEPKDLFQLANDSGDGDGYISIQKFKQIAERIKIPVSDHRVLEIFAKVKGNNLIKFREDQLNQEEFEKALSYLQEKSLTQTMLLLGIDPIHLNLILGLLLAILFSVLLFIFFGINAFVIGGSFGAVINSAFPVLGGLGMSQPANNIQQSITKESIEENVQKANSITRSNL